jgi:hypothetical protein
MAAARDWPSREGTITHTITSHAGVTGRSYWTPVIRGIYRDTGEEFWISRVSYGSIRIGEGRAIAEEQVDRHPVGASVWVYYDPTNPKETILEPFAPWTEMLLLLGAGIAFVLIPILLVGSRKLLARRAW